MTDRFSRRLLLAQAGAALAAVPSLARAAAPVVAGFPPPPAVQNIQGDADAQNRLTVETMLNDQGPFRFVVDTGADRSVLCDEVVKSLGLAGGDEMIVAGIARSLPAPSARLDRLQVGHVVMRDLALPVLPRRWLGCDGYLGLDVIDRQAVTFDFVNHRLTVAPSDMVIGWTTVVDGNVVRTSGSNGRLSAVNCRVDGMRAHAFIDSGAEISIGNSRLFAELAEAGGKYIDDSVIQLLGVTGGAVEGRVTAIGNIRLGPINFVHSALVISDLPVFDVWGLADRPALFIGMNFLRQTSSVTIDYGRKELRFRLANNLKLASRA